MSSAFKLSFCKHITFIKIINRVYQRTVCPRLAEQLGAKCSGEPSCLQDGNAKALGRVAQLSAAAGVVATALEELLGRVPLWPPQAICSLWDTDSTRLSSA